MNIIKTFLVIVAIVILNSCVTGTGGNEYMRPVYVGPGIGLGTIIAVVISWSRNKSLVWAIVHGILGWLYIIYVLIVGKKKV